MQLIVEIVRQTPPYVYGILAALVAFGVMQSRTRERSVGTAVVLGIGLAAWSAYSTATLFPAEPVAAVAAVAAWFAGVLAIQPVGRRLMAEAVTDYDPERRKLTVPGSWLPLALMLSLFLLRYVANVLLVFRPELAASVAFATAMGLGWGVLGGIFIARLRNIGRFIRRFHAVRAMAAA